MLNVFNARNSVLAFAIFGLSGLALTAMNSTANAALTDSCRAGSRNQVIMCCNRYVQRHGMPLWMQSSGSTCQTSVFCGKQKPSSVTGAIANFKKKPGCWYVPTQIDNQGSAPLTTPLGKVGTIN